MAWMDGLPHTIGYILHCGGDPSTAAKLHGSIKDMPQRQPLILTELDADMFGHGDQKALQAMIAGRNSLFLVSRARLFFELDQNHACMSFALAIGRFGIYSSFWC